MAYCPKCRKNVVQGTFCPECGTMLMAAGPEGPDDAAPFSAAPVIDPCPSCGALISTPNWKFCPACGKMHPERRENRVQAQEPSADFSEAEKIFSFTLQSCLADGVISPKERIFLMDLWKKLGLPENCLDILMGCLSSFMVSDDAVTPERPPQKAVMDTTAAGQKAQPETQEEAAPMREPEARQKPEPVEDTPVRSDQSEAMSAFTLALKDKSRTRESVLNAAKPLLCAGVSPKTLSRHVILTLGPDVKNNSDCYVYPVFDAKKLQNAPFALPVVCNENKALFYFDNTMFGKGDEGFLLTDDTFYSSTKNFNVLPYASMTSIHSNKKDLFINGINIDAFSSEKNIAALELMLNVLSELWKASGEMQQVGFTNDQKKKFQEYRLLLNSAIDTWDTDTFTGYVRRMLALRSDRDQLCKEIILYVGKKIKDDSSVYLAPSFNMDKLASAPFVSRAIQADEELILYFDSTIFGKGNEGFVLTNKALYSSEQTLLHVPYHAINAVSGNMKKCFIQIIGQELPMKYVSDERFKTLQYLFELISIIQKIAPLQS